ncbi:zinc finger, CCHC-type containing protein [Tanacetum coccineum]
MQLTLVAYLLPYFVYSVVRPSVISGRQLGLYYHLIDKFELLERQLPPAPVAPAGVKALFAQQAEQELLQTTRDFHACKQEEGQSVSSYVLRMKGYIDNLEHLGHPVTLGLAGQYKGMGNISTLLLPSLRFPLPKREDPAKDSICHECGETGHWKRNCPQYLAELLKKKKNTASGAGGLGIFVIELNTFLNRSWIYDTGCGTHICNTTQGLRASRKLKPGALSLYVGNGQREAVEAIGNFAFISPP